MAISWPRPTNFVDGQEGHATEHNLSNEHLNSVKTDLDAHKSATGDVHPQYTLDTVIAAAGTLAASLTTPGSYYVAGSTAITANGYPASAGLPGVMTVVGAGNHRIQTFTFAAGANVNQMYVRSSADTGATWTAWADPALFHETKTDPHSTAGYARRSVANTFTTTQIISAPTTPLTRIRSNAPANTRRWDDYVDQVAGYFAMIAKSDDGATNQSVPVIFYRDGRAQVGAADAFTYVGGITVKRGSGYPEGVVTAPVGSEYTDSAATNGAIKWVKTAGALAVGWKVSYGDTGWRDIRSLLVPDVFDVTTPHSNSNYAVWRRTAGGGVEIHVRLNLANSFIGQSKFGVINFLTLDTNLGSPAWGYKPHGNFVIGVGGAARMATANNHATAARLDIVPVTGTGTAGVYGSGADLLVAGGIQYAPTAGPLWPSILPGTPL